MAKLLKDNELSMTFDEWNKLIKNEKITDVPEHERYQGFLMFGEQMHVYCFYNGRKYRAQAWHGSKNVTLTPIKHTSF